MSNNGRRDIWDLSSQEALKNAVSVSESTGGMKKNISISAVESADLKPEARGLVRRAFLQGGLTAIIALALDNIKTIPGGLVTNFAYDQGKDAVAGLGRITFKDDFINYIDSYRGADHFSIDDARNKIGVKLNNEEMDTISYMIKATTGGTFSGRDISALQDMVDKSADDRTKLIFYNLIGTDLVRKGLSADASVLINSLNHHAIKDTKSLCRLSELAFNFSYTSIAKSNALSPKVWGFEVPFEMSHKIGLPEVGLELTRDQATGKYAVRFSAPNEAQIKKYEKTFGVAGYYNLFWTMLYYVADLSNRDFGLAVDAANEFYRILVEYIKIDKKYKRTVWNSAFMVALQAHRSEIYSVRDKFAKLLTGIDFGIYDNTYIDDRVAKKDVITYCGSMFILSNPEMCKNIGLHNLPSALNIEQLGQNLTAGELKSSADLFEKIRGRDIPVAQCRDSNLFWGGGLSILIEDQEIIRRGLVKHKM